MIDLLHASENPEFNSLNNYLSGIESSDAYWSIYFIIWVIDNIPSWIVFRSAYCQIKISGIHISPIVFTFLVFLSEISNAAGNNSDVGDIIMLVTSWLWPIKDFGDRINMLPTFLFMLVFFHCIQSVIDKVARSSIS